MATLEIYNRSDLDEPVRKIAVKIDVSRITGRMTEVGYEPKCNIPILSFTDTTQPDRRHAIIQMTWEELKVLRNALEGITRYEYGDRKKYA